MADLADEIETAAQEPASVSADGTSVTNRPAADMIAGDVHVQTRRRIKSLGNGWAATRPVAVTPPGATGSE